MDTLESARLVLRRVDPSDRDDLFALDNDPEVMRYLNGGEPIAADVFDRDIMPVYLERPGHWHGFGFWAACNKTGAFLGWVSLRPRGTDGEAELGYRFQREAWGHGFATEAARLLIDAAIEAGALDRIIATTYQDNLASQRVMQKLGMRFVRAFRMTPEDLSAQDTSACRSAMRHGGAGP